MQNHDAPLSAAPGPRAPLAVHDGGAHRGPLERDCDVVVVGSGAGGATVATELALAGLRVVVLEEGRHVPGDELGAMRQSESIRHVWREGALTAAIGIGGAPTVNVTMGKCVGGSSVLTGGVCFRVPESVLEHWAREHGLAELSAKHFERYYEHVEKHLHVEEVPIAMRSRSTELFARGATKLGYAFEPMRRNTHGCHGCGRCNFGCPHGAKLGVDRSYLPRAVAAGAEVWSRCLVERVDIEAEHAKGVSGRLLNGRFGKPGDRLRVRARCVVLACGAIHTPVLLAASGLAGPGSHVGRHLCLHPGFRLFARFDEEVRGWAGAMQSAHSRAFEHDDVLLNSVFVPASVIAATMVGAGPAHVARARCIPHIAMFGAQVHDEGGGRIWRNPFGREPLVVYRCTERDRRAMRRAIRILAETFVAAGAKEIFLPVLGLDGLAPEQALRFDLERVPTSRLECSSQHPMGTCRMSARAQDGVVDSWGQCWDVKNLFVADASVLPSSLGVNPQLTVMAFATRIAWRLAERMRT